jgi:hypothetical protein
MQDNIVTTDELLRRIAKAVGPGGDFPVSARVVKDLMDMAESPSTTAQEVARIIRRDPTLSARLLSIVNSSFYGRSVAIKDLTQGIIHLGLKPLVKIVGSLILLKKFVPLASQDGAFAHALRSSITTAILHDQISFVRNKSQGAVVTGDPLLSMLSCLGQLLFSYYYPDLYEASRTRSREKDVSLSQALLAVTGATSLDMSMYVLDTLHLSSDYIQIMKRASEMLDDWSFSQFGESKLNDDARLLTACLQISEVIHSDNSRDHFNSTISEIARIVDIDIQDFNSIISELPRHLKEYCQSIDLAVPSLPDYLKDVSLCTQRGLLVSPEPLQDVREAISSGETVISVIGCTLESLVRAMNFKRAIFLAPNGARSLLEGRLVAGDLGGTGLNSLQFTTEVKGNDNIASLAWYYQKIEVTGMPLFANSWPCIAFPVGFGDVSIGVLYADGKINENNDQTIRDDELATISILAELLDKLVRNQRTGL